MGYDEERLWWPIQAPTKEERIKQKARRREIRSSLFMLDLKDGKL